MDASMTRQSFIRRGFMTPEKLTGVLNTIGLIAVALPPLLTGVIGIFMVIPGDQPEKFMQEKLMPVLNNVVEFVKKFSRK